MSISNSDLCKVFIYLLIFNLLYYLILILTIFNSSIIWFTQKSQCFFIKTIQNKIKLSLITLKGSNGQVRSKNNDENTEMIK